LSPANFKKSAVALWKILGNFSAQLKKNAKPIFKAIAKTAILTGVLVSWSEKKALAKKGIKQAAKMEKAKTPKEAAIKRVSAQPK